MAWTTPSTAVAGSTALTAAFWNEQVRDNMANLRALANVVQTVKTDTATISLGARAEQAANISGLEATITPTANTSKVLIRVTTTLSADGGVNAGFILYRGSTAIGIGDAASNRKRITQYNLIGGDPENVVITYVDSPATLSSTTYGVRIYNGRNGTTVYHVNRANTDSDTADFSRAISTIIVQEIPA